MLSRFICIQFFVTPVDYSPPDSSVYGIFQARILERVVMPLFQGIFLTQRPNPCFLHLLHWQAGSFTTSTTWEAQLLLQVWVNLEPDVREFT